MDERTPFGDALLASLQSGGDRATVAVVTAIRGRTLHEPVYIPNAHLLSEEELVWEAEWRDQVNSTDFGGGCGDGF